MFVILAEWVVALVMDDMVISLFANPSVFKNAAYGAIF